MEFADNTSDSALSLQNREIHSELVKKTKKLERLKEKVMDLFVFGICSILVVVRDPNMVEYFIGMFLVEYRK